MPVARVVLDSPLPQLDRLFDYAIPERLATAVTPGVRVRVPVRAARRVMDGFVVELAERSEFEGTLAPLEAVVSPVAVLAPEVWALARRLADRAAGVAADVLRLAIPPRHARAEQALLKSSAVVDEARSATPLVEEARSAVSKPASPIPGYAPELAEAAAAGARLVVRAIPAPDAWAATAADLAAATSDRGETAILVVPDLRDVRRVLGALAARVPEDRVVRLDADQTTADRYRAFLAARTRSGLVVVGTRSAVYAPAGRLGLLLLWDDGDPLHHEPHAPGVHPRDAALVRHELQGGALVLLAHSPSAEAQRLVEIGWCRAIGFAPRRAPRVVPTAMQLGGDRLAEQARIPSSAWRAAGEALERGPVLVQVSRPGEEARAGSGRTAAELGRAFPQARVVLADGEHPVETVPDAPALVVATRGAEPVAAGGYRAVLLLDGERMLARESLRVTEDALRTWSNAIALAAPDAPCYLVGVGGPVAAALAGWRQADVVSAELAQRQALRFPPAVRTATLHGTAAAVEAAIAAAGIPTADVIGPVEEDGGAVRTVIRFDYRRGAEVAAALRTELIRHAIGRRGARRDEPSRRPELRVRMDDPEPFVGERPGVGRMER